MKPLSNLSGAIFDLDGTLLDSMGIWTDIDEKVLKKRGFPADAEYQNAVKHMTFTQAADYTVARYSLKETPEELMKEWTEMAKSAYESDVLLKPYAKELLFALRERGVKLGIATSSIPEFFLPALKRNGVLDCFTTYALTQEAPRGKDFPDVYLLACSRLGLTPGRCAVFEDILLGVKSAKSGGFITVAVYDDCSSHEEAAMREAADYYVRSLEEFLALL